MSSNNQARIDKIVENLAHAFGGDSQLPDHVIGMAIIGQVNNNGLTFGEQELAAVVGKIEDRWQDQNLDTDKIRSEIVRGMKEQAKDWPRKGNSYVWDVIDTLDKGGATVAAVSDGVKTAEARYKG
jgi:hypothetical protein